MLWRHVVWNSATRLGATQRQHLRSECCDHDRRQFTGGREPVDAVEIGTHRRQRFVVAMAAQALDHWNVADAETENEPVAVERIQRDHGALRGEGIACIDVGDRTADRQLLAARQQPGRQRHRLIASRFRVPQVRVAIILNRAHEIAQLRSVELIGAVPHAKASEFHVDCLRLKVRASRYRAVKRGETARIARLRRCGGRPPTYPNGLDPARPQVSRAQS